LDKIVIQLHSGFNEALSWTNWNFDKKVDFSGHIARCNRIFRLVLLTAANGDPFECRRK